MKKITVMITALLLITCTAPVSAKEDTYTADEYIEMQKEEMQSHKDVMEYRIKNEIAVLLEGNENADADSDITIKSYDIDKGIKMYTGDGLIISEYMENKNIEDLFYCGEIWYVPTVNTSGEQGYIEFNNRFGSIGSPSTCSGGGEIVDIMYSYCKKMSTVSDELSNVRVIRANYYRLHMVYFEANGEKYIIPYSQIEERPFENGEIYTADKFFKMMDDTFDETITNPQLNGGGYKIKENKIKKYIPVIAASAVILAAGVTVVIIVRNRKKKTT